MIHIKGHRFLLYLCLTLLLFGCSNKGEDTPILELTITSDKETVKIDEVFTLTAKVIYGNKDISEGTTVEFEFIENGMSLGAVNPSYVGDGVYELEMKLLSTGEHIIVAHVSYEEIYQTDFITFNVEE